MGYNMIQESKRNGSLEGIIMYEEFFTKRLPNLRAQKGVSARDMSLSLGQNPGYINNIETGKALPSMASFFYICEFLEITPQEFFDDTSLNPKVLNEVTENLKKISSEQLQCISLIINGLVK